MKRIYAVLFALVAVFSMASAQDNIYIIKDGAVIKTYSASDVDYITFTKPAKAEAWRVTGTYTPANLSTSFTADLVAYTDGSYAIEKPYGEDGYSIEFTVDDNGYITPTNHYNYSGGYYSLAISNSYYASVYTAGGYSSFSGNKTSGEVWFYTYLYDMSNNKVGSGGYDDFTWGTTAE